MGIVWLIVVFFGAFVLMGAVAWSRWRNRDQSRASLRRTEQATRQLYRGDGTGDRGRQP